jgi:hypothetical protein
MQHSQIKIEAGQLYTPDEVRAWLKISRTTLWRYQQAGFLRPVRMGIRTRSLRFRGEDLLAILAPGQTDWSRHHIPAIPPPAPGGTWT